MFVFAYEYLMLEKGNIDPTTFGELEGILGEGKNRDSKHKNLETE